MTSPPMRAPSSAAGSAPPLRVLFVTAELMPLAKVGGLGEASSGLVRELRAMGVTVEVVMPDYGTFPDPCPAMTTRSATSDGGASPAHRELGTRTLDVPWWAGPAHARDVQLEGIGPVTLVDVPGMARPHPYVDPESGWGWADNDERFFAFSAAVGAIAAELRPDVVHLNDWHTSAAAAFLPPDQPLTLTVHNLSHQGQTGSAWLERLGPRAWAYDAGDHCNPLAGAIRLADRVISVSRTYAREIVQPEHGNGLHDLLAAKGYDLVGIRNGIDISRWDPTIDDYLPANFALSDLSGKEVCNKELRRIAGFVSSRGPIVGMVARMVHQKGVDLALDLAPYLEHMPAHLVLLGTGEPHFLEMAERTAARYPGRLWIAERYDDELAHLLVAGSDLMLVPSRFEPCGLTQMEAMAYGTIPVVTDVGGLHDTVIDTDADPRRGTGFVASSPDPLPLLDALHRGVRGWGNGRRRLAMQQRAMGHDWSWRQPAVAHLDLYRTIAR